MEKRIQVQIAPDGKITAKVLGVKGKSCTRFIPLLEAMLEAKAIDSEYTTEYRVSEESQQVQSQQQIRPSQS